VLILVKCTVGSDGVGAWTFYDGKRAGDADLCETVALGGGEGTAEVGGAVECKSEKKSEVGGKHGLVGSVGPSDFELQTSRTVTLLGQLRNTLIMGGRTDGIWYRFV
jgi:hypothetical protein